MACRRAWAVRSVLTALVVGAGGLPAAADAPPPSPRYEVVAQGLDNPRGITVGEGGAVFVAEAGRGGTRCTRVGRATLCGGDTGSVTRVAPSRRTVLEGVPSLARPGGYAAIGLADVHARAETLFVVLGDRTGLPDRLERPEFGTIREVASRRSAIRRADV
jgi:glucose/arabinose dehydrogenase